jgi:CheY-like chemotaxis protein
MHVLVVDDDETVRSSLEDALRAEGVRVSVAACGQEALERITADPPDLVLTDVRMPDVDGLELLRRVRAGARAGAPAVDVVLMTAYDDARVAIAAARAGARACLAKPLDLVELRTLVGRLLSDREPGVAPPDPSLAGPGSVP